jgi:hypothetical protein
VVIKAALVWVLGLLTIVPYGTYYLLFRAERDQYALLITLVLFWIFGYWGVAGPLIGLVTARRVFRAIEQASSSDELLRVLRSEETRDVAIDLIASEHGIPRFVAARIYRWLLRRLPAPPTADA